MDEWKQNAVFALAGMQLPSMLGKKIDETASVASTDAEAVNDIQE